MKTPRKSGPGYFRWAIFPGGKVAFCCSRHPGIVSKPFRGESCTKCEDDRVEWQRHFGVLTDVASA